MDTVSRLVEELAVAIGDQQDEQARNELELAVNDMRDSLLQLRRDTRAALLASKKTIDSKNASHAREELFHSSAVKEKQSFSEKVTDDALMEANDTVTEALRRTITLMQGELERSVLTTQMLDDSTAMLRATSQTHDSLNSLMLTSKQLITALEKADWLDRIIILSAFLFFILVVLFILKQRFIDRGLRIALWWTRFIPRPQKQDVMKVVEEGRASITAVITSTLPSILDVPSSSIAEITSSTVAAIPESPTVEIDNHVEL
ncbi:hypothetical protein AGABI1DRAFT_112054 [Agaricus bisporus var. burnettii JB137-S8]|uniref:Sec20 C-terminal domain-containing protein n=1 Tax=Agaricus bisporus var. burnettii (strain JB137-S8 / ATCC MYA-4627 / FGSC 10392) TaxID=597362 RepID=K5X1X5_AGABU|nr:uncharacterized protein AGABI1DRAFT_112054 [Agaricus bisporus var. burnettii JB137-S8]EKM81816.1 hypothetical protein AGABI1DRAFT_112054 [Agaricus bisporus var. burnettii JB137-S8]